MTAIAIPIFVKSGVDLEDAIGDAEDALRGGIAGRALDDPAMGGGLLELRCDQASPKQMLEAIDLARLPVIVTVRPKWEGGFSEKSDDNRIELWEAAMDAGADYIDVELVSWEKNAKIRDLVEDGADKAGTRLIVSNHCFDGRPADLDARLARLKAVTRADVLKIAWKAESLRDGIDALVTAARLKRETGKPTVALAMGEEGLLSRLLAKKFGAPFTFATAEAGKESAPGQPTVHDLRHRYRWAAQNPATAVYGVVGWPVGHSLSPHIHNAGFAALSPSVDAVYVPLPVKPTDDAFAAAVDALRAAPGMHLRGLSVTIPHKENAFRYAAERGAAIDDLSARLGVVNTFAWKNDTPAAGFTAFNSDYAGALDALVSAWTGKRSDVAGKRIAVLGAGGAARAIVAALAAHGATVVVYNRTKEKADALAAECSVAAANAGGKVVAALWEKLCDSCCEAYINCTPLGMHPQVQGSPLDAPPPGWSADTVVFDTVYNPRITKLLKVAQAAGAKIVPGTEMFVRQAAAQFHAWTGQNAPLDVFRRVLDAPRY